MRTALRHGVNGTTLVWRGLAYLGHIKYALSNRLPTVLRQP